MTRIMFVCHGNICRSPMAEFIFKRMIKERGLDGEFLITSSATSAEEIVCGVGKSVYPPAREELARHGISCDGKRAVQLKKEDGEYYDMLIGMDSANIRNMHRILGEDAHDKIFKLMGFAGKDADVSDPWYSERFDVAYRDIFEGCEGLMNYLLEKK